tara:strand:+ start:53 stop:427 length:375 start_codon:yes stop_codon:yes gene_type:complete
MISYSFEELIANKCDKSKKIINIISMHIKIEEKDNQSIIYLSGEIDLSNADSIKEQAIKLLERKKDLILNLSGVTYIDSSGISILIESHKNAMQQGVKSILQDVSKEALKVIMMARLEQILIIE